jgi:C1A family cysteine protease
MAKRVYNLKPDKTDLRDYIFRSTKYVSAESLPSAVDLRSQMSPVVDQGQLGSCTANAIGSGLREFLELKNHVPFVQLSRLYLYWHEREMEGTLGEDAGAEIRDGMSVLEDLGICPEADFPYVISTYNNTPSAKAEADAPKYKIATYSRINNLTMLKTSVAEDYPVVIGFEVFSSFESDDVAQTGWVPMPQYGEDVLGGHAVLAVGYNESQRVVICRNSWGVDWGDQGYFYLPYGFWTAGYVFDMWTGNV